MDFTNTFSSLSENNLKNKKKENSDFKKWKQKWSEEINLKEAKKLMKKNNPIFIPRNHLVEESIEMASNGDYCLFNEMLEVLSCPYENNDNLKKFKNPPNESFEKCFKTYCGT